MAPDDAVFNDDSIYAGLSLRYPAAQHNDFELNVNLKLPCRGITGIFGPSGSGKTTLLRCIAGLQQAQGKLSVQGATWQDETIFLPPHQRPVGYVFQEHNLFPHLTARGNLQYAVKRSSPGTQVQFDHIISLLGIAHLLNRYPQQLSGGERQRVAIARALLVNPRLLLLDEPLSSLDAARKQEILPYLERLRGDLAIPVLYVSHAMDEIARLADHLVVLDHGKVAASGPLQEVLTGLDLPILFGEDAGAVLQARVMGREDEWNLLRVAFPGGGLWVRDSGEAIGAMVRVRVLARDISLALQPHANTSITNLVPGKITEIVPEHSGAMTLVRIDTGESILIARITRRSAAQLRLIPGLMVWMQIKSAAIVR